MREKQRDRHKRKVLELRHKFLRERGTDGGTKSEFEAWLLKHLPDLLNTITANQAVIALSSSYWRTRLKPRNKAQLEIPYDGEPLPYIVRFRKITAEDEDREDKRDRDVSVLCQHATIWQFGGHVDIKGENKARCDKAYERAKRQYELALARAGGDPYALLVDLQDGFEDEDAG